MNIKKAHCFFEQSGTFKNAFKHYGIDAEDYDIQNNFKETDNVIDLFAEIEKGYDGKPSVFDRIGKDDLIIAFFPCIYFCESSQCAFRDWHFNYRTWDDKKKYATIIAREMKRTYFYTLLIKLVAICKFNGLRIVIENPYTQPHYLHNNFLKDPDIVDMDRTKKGDNFKKPTAFWFFNCKPTRCTTMQKNNHIFKIRKTKSAPHGGLCSEERSIISSDYALNFINDFLLGGGGEKGCNATNRTFLVKGEEMTLEQIKAMSAAKIARQLQEYQKYRRGEPPYDYGITPHRYPFSAKELGAIIDRAVEILKEVK